MDKTVLIVDDDQEFSLLLKGIYEQADYTVYTAVSADQALEVIRDNPIQLVVTDQRLPGGISGSDLISRLRQMEVSIPVIMVSGFLNVDSIRQLIREGVAGVFMKPLNIFSLLKKSSEILKEREAVLRKGGGPSGTQTQRTATIGHIEGLSEKGKWFLKRAHESASFKRNLLLIGPSGTLFEEIARDIVALAGSDERCVCLRPGEVSEATVERLFSGEQGERPLTLVLLEAEHLSAEEVDRLILLVDERGGSASSLRMIFCLSQSVETLFDKGMIDEEFYLFLGSNELRVPPIREMPEDLVAVARHEIVKQCKSMSFDMKLRSLLLAHDWPDNMLELRSVIVRAISFAQPFAPTVRHFEAALRPIGHDTAAEQMARSSLERFLIQEKHRYLAALHLLHKA